MPCGYNPYTLPTIEFVGGSTQELKFRLFFRSTGRPISISVSSAKFDVVPFEDKKGTTVISKTMTSATENGGTVLKTTLVPSDTKELEGKYIYQISIRDTKSVVDIPSQGIMYITNNINKGFIT